MFDFCAKDWVLALSAQPSALEVRSSALSVSGATIADFEPDVVLLDAAERGNLELALPASTDPPNTRIVAFALADIDEAIIACAEAGVSGYVSRHWFNRRCCGRGGCRLSRRAVLFPTNIGIVIQPHGDPG